MIPKHIAIIPDGNRRWAKSKRFSLLSAYKSAGSYEKAKKLGEEAKKCGVEYISIWAFSTENWKRNKNEIKFAFQTIEKFIDASAKKAERDKYRFICIGNQKRIPKEIFNKIRKLEKKTRNFKGLAFILCLNYGGRDEIIRAVSKALKEKRKITEKNFSEFLDTKNIPDPDLIIRTGGEKRLSGFMPFQTIYSELYFTNILFPDFTAKHLKEAIEDFKKRKRNLGK
ncbi:di-trans,poly-cis-decaprenylcistransferase [Candidatus Pacearchaeota archaeon]|nr:di-trans,poly-cis-decaprenylcistransferase [Candidatus Pacearchaeota archaeon]